MRLRVSDDVRDRMEAAGIVPPVPRSDHRLITLEIE